MMLKTGRDKRPKAKPEREAEKGRRTSQEKFEISRTLLSLNEKYERGKTSLESKMERDQAPGQGVRKKEKI